MSLQKDDELIILAHAKINLGLDVLGKREDGYHEIKTLMVAVGIHDTLTFSKADSTSITFTDPSIDIPLKSNIVYKAIENIASLTKSEGRLKVTIEKLIPSQAGLGGGSSDGAAALVAFDKLYGPFDRNLLLKAAVMTGADVAYFLYDGLCLCEGIGEIVTKKVSLGDINCLILRGKEKCDTKTAYGFMDTVVFDKVNDFDRIYSGLKKLEKVATLNSFEKYFEHISDELINIRKDLLSTDPIAYGLSGSGSCFYSLYRDNDTLSKAYVRLKDKYEYIEKTSLVDVPLEVITK